LLVVSLEALDGLSEPDWLEAFDGHPKLGEAKQAARADAEGARLSSQEQSGVQAAAAATLARLAEGNAAYAARHGFIFILFASGRTAGEVLGELEARIDAPRAVELERAAGEQRKITQRRIEGFVEG
jgi:2-oxo-4-hydroxy-4-carboxy-5-ureidoimidazoline decarboxylase